MVKVTMKQLSPMENLPESVLMSLILAAPHWTQFNHCSFKLLSGNNKKK